MSCCNLRAHHPHLAIRIPNRNDHHFIPPRYRGKCINFFMASSRISGPADDVIPGRTIHFQLSGRHQTQETEIFRKYFSAIRARPRLCMTTRRLKKIICRGLVARPSHPSEMGACHPRHEMNRPAGRWTNVLGIAGLFFKHIYQSKPLLLSRL